MNLQQPSTLQALLLVGRGVAIETIRRKEFYVLLIFAAIYVVGLVLAAIVGVENEQTLLFLLNLGITFAYLSAHLLTIITAARQIPTEIENRTIYPLLAKPLSRDQYILGKWAACAAAGLFTFVVLFALTYLPWLLIPKQLTLSTPLLMQALAVNVVSLSAVSALTIALSLWAPTPVTMTLAALVFFTGSPLINFIVARAQLQELGEIARWFTAYLPNFSHLNLFNRYTDGIEALGAPMLLAVLLYGALWCFVPLILAGFHFRRRPL
jgi:ABC-type transport system involved in multi-copper enzyme maturation permease subunit